MYVGPMYVRCMPPPDRALKSSEEIDAAGYRLVAPSEMLLNVRCRSNLTPKKIGKGLLNIGLPSMYMLGCQAASEPSRLNKAVSHLDELRVNLSLANQATTSSTSGCEDTMITSLLRACGYPQIIRVGTRTGIVH